MDLYSKMLNISNKNIEIIIKNIINKVFLDIIRLEELSPNLLDNSIDSEIIRKVPAMPAL